MAGIVYNKVYDVSHGVSPYNITEAQSVTLEEAGTPIDASGDDDVFIDGQAIKLRRVTGTIVTKNMLLAVSTLTYGNAGESNLVFKTDDPVNGTTLTYTISNVMLLPPSHDNQHDGDGNTLTINFQARSTDGQTDPVAIASA